jgi:hypothetical protein
MKKARRDIRGQKPEEIYVIEDKQLHNIGPGGRVATGGDITTAFE